MTWKKTEHFKETEFGPMKTAETIEYTHCSTCQEFKAERDCAKKLYELTFYECHKYRLALEQALAHIRKGGEIDLAALGIADALQAPADRGRKE